VPAAEMPRAGSFLRILASYAQPHRVPLLIGTGFLVVEALFGLLLPYLGGRFVDAVLADASAGQTWTLSRILLALALLFTLQAALAILGGYLSAKRAVLIATDLRQRVFSHILRLPLPYLQEREQGRILSVLTNDVAQLSHYLSSAVVSVPPAIVTGIGSTLLMLTIDWRMALAAAAAVPLFYVLIKLVGRGLRPLSMALQEAYARVFTFEEERVHVLPAVKAFGRERVEEAGYQREVERLVDLSLRQDWRQLAIGPGMVWAGSMGVLAILWVAGDRIVGGEMTKGTIVTFLLYTALLTRPISNMAGLYGETQHARAAVDRIEALMRTPRESYGEDRPALVPRGGEIVFDAIRFAYPGRDVLFERFSLRIRPGEVIAITGENGVGKSTLISFLLRFNTPESGRVLIDGQDIAECSLDSVRGAIGYVSQQVYLLNASVRENIAFGRVGADFDALCRAARQARALEFIERLPAGWDTVIGDDGVRLSGGQRQRIALARVLLRDPAIVILDEATSMYDPEAELEFIAECQQMLRDRSVLLITHRPASLRLADRIIHLSVPQDGSVCRPRLEERSAAADTSVADRGV